jgi:N,N-dimethylformamidase beta subunit-like protein
VSFDRPYDWQPGPGGQPLEWEYPLVRFLERSGYELSYQTDVDSDADPASLLRHRLVITAGHGEYWTKTMRNAFEAARNSGGNLAFLGANTGYWQVRYEDGGRTIVAYKSRYDPEPHPALKTTMFRDLEPPRYECELLGVQSQGVKLDWLPSDYPVAPGAIADPWLRGTGFRAGDVLRRIVSVESDTIPGNQTAADSCGHRLTVFFHHETGSDKSRNADAVPYTTASGARVFAFGSHTFAWGLDDFGGNPDETHGLVDPRLQRFMRNASDDLTRPAPPTSIDVRATGQGVLVSVDRLPDARVLRVIVVRRQVGRARTVRVCSVARRTHAFCRDRVGRGAYRYFAVAADRWRTSFSLRSATVRVP